MTVTKFFEVGQKFPQILTLKTFRDMGTTELLLILKLQLVLWYLYIPFYLQPYNKCTSQINNTRVSMVYKYSVQN